MAQVCYTCGKKAISGNLVSHAKNRIKRRFKPNLQGLWIMEKGKKIKVKLCTKCLRRVKASAKPQVPSTQAQA
jgi:large subunit ribosomal protein L28